MVVLEEFNLGWIVYEVWVNDGDIDVVFYEMVDNFGFSVIIDCCVMSVVVLVNGVGSVSCKIKGNLEVNGRIIIWVRNGLGVW